MTGRNATVTAGLSTDPQLETARPSFSQTKIFEFIWQAGRLPVFSKKIPNSLEISKEFGKVCKIWKKHWKNFSKVLSFGTTI
jgi:hypothetical protein